MWFYFSCSYLNFLNFFVGLYKNKSRPSPKLKINIYLVGMNGRIIHYLRYCTDCSQFVFKTTALLLCDKIEIEISFFKPVRIFLRFYLYESVAQQRSQHLGLSLPTGIFTYSPKVEQKIIKQKEIKHNYRKNSWRF